MQIFIAADHAGYALKEVLLQHVAHRGHRPENMGAYTLAEDDDYPPIVAACVAAVARTPGSRGVVIGGSGEGEAMVANRTPGIRAIEFYGPASALGALDSAGAGSVDGFDIIRLGRAHNDANVLSLGARFLSEADAITAVDIFIDTAFSAEERHVRRIGEF